MSKAEDRALEAYPKDIEEFIDVNNMKSIVDNNSWHRTIFLKGYHQAEEDLELTWEDIEEIYFLVIETDNAYMEANAQNDYQYDVKEMYQEVLKRFNKERKEK